MTLIAFDFDGTLSDSEMTVSLGERAGVADEMRSITERAMADEIDYAESLRERAGLLAGLPDDEAAAAFDGVRLRPDAGALLRRLDAAGHHVAILTGGFERGVARALAHADASEAVDTVVANALPVADGALTGEVTGPLIEGTKDDALAVLAAAVDEAVATAVAVGDGANDLPMLAAAGLAVGYEPKAAVEPTCDETVASMTELATLFEREGLLD
ncbi:HAD family hydrolase [Halobaculum sp. MBLA0147]|uniref:HAD family hydrolase n=1 Tax=Halobaculum sp. MBLA0147 TaxID=3079934 RepID=UPI0035248D33